MPMPQRAAQYARMSTDHQRYSIDNQSDVIAAYAAVHNFTIVRTYTDAGRSGLRALGRDALLQLIEDVNSGRADFGTILVYDISRWGRFQDSDEAAYYEFICRNAGVNIRYCAEQFENDSSLVTTIVKGMKRAMAAEFSRELSCKVLEGQKRLAALGFHRGGPAPFGLRRLLVDERGVPKLVLGFKQEKHMQTDRVILVPGPPHDVKIVRDIFRMFVRQRTPPTHIARLLNERHIPNALGNRWTPNNVFKLLKNRSYIGTLIYNRTTQKLLSKARPNPRSMGNSRANVLQLQLCLRLPLSVQCIADPRSLPCSDLYAREQQDVDGADW
jgi:DNA invertase Pin-like site-specific DNA recombinase